MLKTRREMEEKYCGGSSPQSWKDCVAANGPVQITLGCDDTCNLCCHSCRSSRHVNTKEQNEALCQMLDTVVRPALDNCHYFSGMTNGEFFASKPVMAFFQSLDMRQYPNMKFSILTNGMLLTEESWNRMTNLHGRTELLTVSVDGATRGTYESLRNGARWDTLCRNMTFISYLRKSGQIDTLQLQFVVQADNRCELEDMVRLAASWNADAVNFLRITNWGTWSEEQFAAIDVCNPRHPHYHEFILSLERAQQTGEKVAVTHNCL